MRLSRLVMVAGLAVLSAGFARLHDDPTAFPHAKHAKLFPTGCAGCHAGIPTESETDRFPSPEACAQCHNGRDQKEVTWTRYVEPATNLRFSHADHIRDSQSQGTAVECQSCHRDPRGDGSPMSVAHARPSNCIACHAHKVSSHLADEAQCSTCHVPLTRAVALTDSTISRFPKPQSHASENFVATHGSRVKAGANCATCHSVESCARCHPNADRIAARAQLAPDERVARLVSMLKPTYPTPASHLVEGWRDGHGDFAKRDAQSCANCHTQASCSTCHRGSNAPRAIAVLAMAGKGTAPGVTVANLSIHPAGFATTHGTSAASGRLECTSCHEQKFCSDCHDGSSRRRFHASNYMARHAADAYSADKNCTSCHNTETFCRSCHNGEGITGKGAGTGSTSAHNGQPLWILQHSQAARQGLDGCTTCHQQRDCLKCHSTLGRNVNPHGSGFDASRYASRNRQMCMTCHLTDPLAKQP